MRIARFARDLCVLVMSAFILAWYWITGRWED